VRNLVFHVKGRRQFDRIEEYGAEEDIRLKPEELAGDKLHNVGSHDFTCKPDITRAIRLKKMR
jgi:hypothetical protein